MIWSVTASLVGGILLLAGMPKAGDYDGLLRIVRGYRLLPPPLERGVARTLPGTEIAVGALLILGIAGRQAAAVAAVLFAGFFIGLTVNLLRERYELDCGCFAFAQQDHAPRIGWFHSSRAALLTAVAAALAVTGPADVTVGEQATAIGLTVIVLSAVVAGIQLRTVVHVGRRPVDEHLSNASIELRAVGATSRYDNRISEKPHETGQPR